VLGRLVRKGDGGAADAAIVDVRDKVRRPSSRVSSFLAA
jgi:hypothetical protein